MKEVFIPVQQGSSNAAFQQALAKGSNKQPLVINLEKGKYYFSRDESVKKVYHVSNTTSEEEDTDPTKHIALHLSNLKNVTINGNGATLVMLGEMTSFVVNESSNITFKNVNFDYETPTQPEITVVEVEPQAIVVKVHPRSIYRIHGDRLEWYGDGWSFDRGIAQAYDADQDITWRTESPMEKFYKVEELEKNVLKLYFKDTFATAVGRTYQLRDAIRDEVAGFINLSKDITFEQVNFFYLGNFGVVCQTSENISFDRMSFAPEPGSGRSNAGFADFIQVSGCRGLITVKNSNFAGAHDDPINVHGTHLQVTELIGNHKVKVRYMHPQTYGFQSFFKGDKVEFIHSKSLNSLEEMTVKSALMLDDRTILIEFEKPFRNPVVHKGLDLVLENATWTPEVHILNNYFTRIPTRGILVTTRKKVRIEGNYFHRMQMSGILIANDALSWFESGMVRDVLIRNNVFYECGYPIINIAPENNLQEQAVHKDIKIEDNIFILKKDVGPVVSAKSVDGLLFQNNKILSPDIHLTPLHKLVVQQDVNRATLFNNILIQK
ncbi:right-handed parallel beta-helix repeat-containing protein [Sphingobacterium sp. Mn56C]|uniref:right-handed parallel beta-helix repeat-containing protein n=1 Tax=Sphingobacterium sp. Mn56C TaxID=3395261 RepID=UPI003BCFF61C